MIIATVLFLAAPVQGAPTATQDAAATLERVAEADWKRRLARWRRLEPTEDSEGQMNGLTDVSPAAYAAEAEAAAATIAELEAIDPTLLEERDRVTRLMLIDDLKDTIESHRWLEWQIPLNADSGFHTTFARLPDETDFRTEEDVRRYISKLKAWRPYVDQQIANMKAGQERGFVLPLVVMLGLETSLMPYIVDVDSHPFAQKLDELPDSIDAETQAALRKEGRAAVEDSVTPGFQAFRRFLLDAYIPGGRSTLGAKHLPDGEEYYAYLVRRYTTLDQTPKEVHEIGLAEVARIRTDMEALIQEVEFEGSFADFLSFLRTDEQFYARDADELLGRAARICKDVDGLLPRYFNTLPRQPYGVEPVPMSIAPKYTSGRYVRAPLSSERAGTYWVNTYELKSRPLYALPALSLHEAVPGHHLQIALNAELEGLPPFRQSSSITAFVEGWALYTEWLGIEMGIYDDPYKRFGRMTYEMWRACRLVVDTGLHQFDWTREQAIDYLSSNTALSIHECTTEVDRYIAWPGQALAYKTGEIEIRKLRAEAEKALGGEFDVREFHHVLLKEGTIPLSVLRQNVVRWIASKKG